MVNTLAEHEALIRALLAQQAGGAGDRLDTHSATVLLRGHHAYKIKKPLHLGAVDYRTLEQRHAACAEEVRLNRRLAPSLYLGSVPISGSLEQPQLEARGTPIDWAVKMRRFDPQALLSNRPQDLNRGLVEKIAARIADLHATAAVCGEDCGYGTPDVAYASIQQNFSQIRSRRGADRGQLDAMSEWSEYRFAELQQQLQERKHDGRVRECHGDLHLDKIALMAGEPVIFGGIEFAPSLRWVDTANDLAGLTMDLTRAGRADLARYLLNAYLQLSGDFEALAPLRFYEVYRAMLRAKLHAIEADQRGLTPDQRTALVSGFRRHLRLAEAFSRPGPRGLIITLGVAASGKSTLSGSLMGRIPAVRVRSEVERKRLAGLDPEARSLNRLNAGIYSPDMTERTYERLAELAALIIESGFVAIVDATFLERSQRQRFIDLANAHDVPCVILNCQVPEPVLRERIEQRSIRRGGDSEAGRDILAAQLARLEPLGSDERPLALEIQAGDELELDDLVKRFG
jgi:aminoglycoside phosphotransferase family enzyme/predicted kinase